jgi:pimeloyl-ACP methyl ester carboxylesterase
MPFYAVIVLRISNVNCHDMKIKFKWAVVGMLLLTASNLTAQSIKPTFARPDLVKPFKLAIPQARIDKIYQRLKHSEFPRQMPGATSSASLWETGSDITWLKKLRDYWVANYDWRKAEARLNRYAQYIADVDGQKIHFYYVPGETPAARPLILTHGWPGSVVEFINTIEPLTNPSKFGGKPEDAFTVVIPSLPGFGFSGMPEKPIGAKTAATLWNKLMTEVIGHKSYLAQGGDFGAVVTSYLAYMYPKNVRAIHLNMYVWGTPIPPEVQTQADREYLAVADADWQANFDYGRMQINRPLMPGVALQDSPIGTANWIAEKIWLWSDNAGALENVIPMDDIITDVMIYLLSEGGLAGSFWFYRGLVSELNGKFHPGYIEVPTALAQFPKEFAIARPPLETARRAYNVYRLTTLPRGGHFAAWEQPNLFVEDVRSSFHDFR